MADEDEGSEAEEELKDCFGDNDEDGSDAAGDEDLSDSDEKPKGGRRTKPKKKLQARAKAVKGVKKKRRKKTKEGGAKVLPFVWEIREHRRFPPRQR